MTKEEKAAQLAEYYYAYDVSKDNCEHYDLYASAMEMHEWTKERALESFCFANCTEPMKRKCFCENTCAAYRLFKSKLEEL